MYNLLLPLLEVEVVLRCYYVQKDVQMVNKYMKRCSASLVITEMQIKTTVKYHCTPLRMAKL